MWTERAIINIDSKTTTYKYGKCECHKSHRAVGSMAAEDELTWLGHKSGEEYVF